MWTKTPAYSIPCLAHSNPYSLVCEMCSILYDLCEGQHWCQAECEAVNFRLKAHFRMWILYRCISGGLLIMDGVTILMNSFSSDLSFNPLSIYPSFSTPLTHHTVITTTTNTTSVTTNLFSYCFIHDIKSHD